MSLIYSALSRLEPDPGAQAAPEKAVVHPYRMRAEKRGAPRWVYLTVSGCILAVLAGWLSMTVLREKFVVAQLRAPDKLVTPAPAPAAAIQPAPTVPVAQAVPVSASIGEIAALAPPPARTGGQARVEVPTIAVQPIAPPAPAKIVAPMAVARAVAPAPVVTKAGEPIASEPAAAAQVAAPKDTGSRIEMMVERPQAEIKTMPAKIAHANLQAMSAPAPLAQANRQSAPPAAAADEMDAEKTNSLALSIKRAIQAGKNDEADSLLKQLGTRLPPDSITLLRLRAWRETQGGDQLQAIALYRQIVARIPDDETAAINLALLYWKAGQQEEARSLIGAQMERHPESETVQRYSRQFGAFR